MTRDPIALETAFPDEVTVNRSLVPFQSDLVG